MTEPYFELAESQDGHRRFTIGESTMTENKHVGSRFDLAELTDDLKALTDEFGLRFQLADPDAKVSVEQRTINNLFFALLEARKGSKKENHDDR